MADYRFKCPRCGHPIETGRNRGDLIKCAHCTASVKVPADAAEVIPAALIEVMGSPGGTAYERREEPEDTQPPPRFIIKQRGCFLQSLNCGCGCLLIILLVGALVYGLIRLLFG